MNKCTCNQYKYCYVMGPKGEDGTGTIEVGKTITLYPFQDASVKNIGTKENAILEFSIPRGKDGDKITIGKTETLDANARARVVDNYVNNIHTLDFYIPQGFDGADGDVGPKGDTGESEKINIIETKTIDAGLQASVTDDFKDNTHNLTFLIPKGMQGDIGPQGVKGEIGISEKINIVETKTIDAGNNASVTDNFSNNTHNLTFMIPKGEKGSTSTPAYASLYENNGNSYTLNPGRSNQIELGTTSASKNVDTSFTNTVRIKNSGTYKIDYFFSAQSNSAGDISLTLRKENVEIPGSKITVKVADSGYAVFNGSIIVNLNANEKIDMAVSSDNSLTLTPGENTIAYLNLMKLE